MSKNEQIELYMKNLEISRAEAEQLWQDDHDDVVTPEMEEMERKAKQIKRYEKSDTPRKKATKERKVDEEKEKIISGFRVFVEGLGGKVTEKKNETEFSFLFGENSYTVKLIKHRPKKEK